MNFLRNGPVGRADTCGHLLEFLPMVGRAHDSGNRRWRRAFLASQRPPWLGSRPYPPGDHWDDPLGYVQVAASDTPAMLAAFVRSSGKG